MKKIPYILPAVLAAALVLTGCRNSLGSYSENLERTDALEGRVAALERENEALRGQVEALAGAVSRQAEELDAQRRELEEQQAALNEQTELLENYKKVWQWVENAREEAGDLAGRLQERFTGWFDRVRYEYDERRVSGMGAEPQLGLLLGVVTGDGGVRVTFDPVEWNDENGEEAGWTINGTSDDIVTRRVAEETYYGIDGSVPAPITRAQLLEKASAEAPIPFTFYVLDGEVYLIAERYVP